MTEVKESTEIGIDAKNRIIRLDHTALEDFRTCLHKGFRRTIEGLVPLGEGKSVDLQYGTAWHTAMDELYSTGWNLEHAKDAWAEATVDLIEDTKSKKTIGRGLDDLEAYAARYADELERWELVEAESVKKIAMEIRVHSESADGLGGQVDYWTLEYVGAIDKVLKRYSSGEIRVRDHKTLGYVNMYSATTYLNSMQLRGYAVMLAEMGAWPVSADIDICAITRQKPPSEFLRPEILATEAMVEDWKRDMVQYAKLIIECAKADVFPKVGYPACLSWSRPCAYFDICIAEPDVRDIVAEAQYEERRWDPGNRDGGKNGD
jgi:hypothetical protein